MTTIPLRVFLLGMVWAMVSAMAPAAVLILNWTARWSNPPDWNVVGQVSLTCAIGGAIGYWRKYKALLQLPPDLQEARLLAQQVTTVTTTATVERQTYPPATVTTTVQETKVTQGEKQ